jgi:hypothetical protein
MFYIYTYIVVMYNFFCTLAQSQCEYLSNTPTWSCVNVLGHVNVYIIYLNNDHIFLQIHINKLWVHVLMVFSYNGRFCWPITKNIMKFSPPQIKVTFLTLFYTYIVSHSHIKPYKCI